LEDPNITKEQIVEAIIKHPMVYHVTHGCESRILLHGIQAAMSDMVNHQVFDDSLYDLLLGDLRVLQDPFDTAQPPQLSTRRTHLPNPEYMKQGWATKIQK
jgi:hypothetical protein